MDIYEDELYHHGILGMKWGVRRYQNYDGTYTKAGLARYNDAVSSGNKKDIRDAKKNLKESYKYDKKIDKYGGKEKRITGESNDKLMGEDLVKSAIGYTVSAFLGKMSFNALKNAASYVDGSSQQTAANLVAGVAGVGALGVGLGTYIYGKRTPERQKKLDAGPTSEMNETLKKYNKDAWAKKNKEDAEYEAKQEIAVRQIEERQGIMNDIFDKKTLAKWQDTLLEWGDAQTQAGYEVAEERAVAMNEKFTDRVVKELENRGYTVNAYERQDISDEIYDWGMY